jgi:hypothetical protein
MTRAGIFGAALLVLLGAVLLIRVPDHVGVPPSKTDHPPLEVRAVESQPVIETVDLRNGNLHVEIPIRAARQKTDAQPSHQ